MTVTPEMTRTEYGSIDQTQLTGPLSPIECQQVVDDILESLKSPNSPSFNPSLSAELQIWTELKKREADPIANAIVDMVRAGQIPLHRFFPATVQTFVSRVDMMSRQQQVRDGGGQYGRQPYGGGMQQQQPQQSSRYR
jgi:hypothetical protein